MAKETFIETENRKDEQSRTNRNNSTITTTAATNFSTKKNWTPNAME